MGTAIVVVQVLTGFKPEYSSQEEPVEKCTLAALSGGLLYHLYAPKYQVDEIKCFVVPWAHRQTALDGCHQDAGNQGKKRMESLVSD